MSGIGAPRNEAEQPSAHPPLRMSAYSVFRVLTGGTSHVYLCEEIRDGLPAGPVAVKRLNHSLAEVEDLYSLFMRECYHWLQMGSHPNLVQALRVHETWPDSPLLVMEYHPGSLREFLQGEPLPADTALRLMLSIVDGLLYAGRMIDGFVHGDLKPENVLISAEHVAKVTDLGLARSIEEALSGSGQGSAAESAVRPPGALRGTVLYMSPEQIRGEEAIECSDVYAWACIAYELMAGLPAYGRPASSEDYELQHLSGRPSERLREVSPSGDMTPLILSGLDKNPENRPGMQSVRDEVARVMASRGLATDVPEPGAFDISIAYSAVQGLSRLGFHKQALDAARKLYDALDNPKDAAVKAMTASVIAACLNELSEYEQAETLLADEGLNSLTAEDPTAKANLLIEKSRLLLGKAEELHKQALQMIEEATSLVPDSSAGWANMATIRYRMQDPDGAIENLERALLYSKRILLFMYVIPWLTERGRHREALNYATMAVQLHPDSGVAYGARCIAALDAVLNSITVGQEMFQEIIEAALHDAQKAREYGVPAEMQADIADRLMKVRRRAIVLSDSGQAEGE